MQCEISDCFMKIGSGLFGCVYVGSNPCTQRFSLTEISFIFLSADAYLCIFALSNLFVNVCHFPYLHEPLFIEFMDDFVYSQ